MTPGRTRGDVVLIVANPVRGFHPRRATGVHYPSGVGVRAVGGRRWDVETHLETVGDVAVLELLGDAIDTSNAADVRRQLADLAAGHPKLLLDLNRVRFLDSSGCAVLVDGQKRFHEAGGELRLCRPTGEVKTVLE